MNTINTLKNLLNKFIIHPEPPINTNIKRYILAIYLFGSFSKNSQKKDSDIDLAFVFNELFYKIDPFIALQQAELLSIKISKNIKRLVDVVVLNGCSLSFAYFTVRNGICLYEKNSVERILYEVSLDNKYHDFKPFIEELRELKKDKVSGRN
ncbi:MAG: nucleotidyltransferase domain-containing protein [Nitrospirae bacterium]|nr:nucleotidyltransferase domain-containing protein [Nitrospirota bacterium]